MEISELVGIGRLGRLEPDGFYHVQFSQPYKSILNQLQDCFLIFSSHRVFYVTVFETKTFGKQAYLRFREDGIDEEAKKHSNVVIALPAEDLADAEDEDDVSLLFGFQASFAGEEIGVVSRALVSPMQAVLIIELNDGRELLVPNVEKYVSKIDRHSKTVRLQNIEQLLELCTSTS